MKRGHEEMSRHETSLSRTRLRHGEDINIPLDITVEILKKLPTKSLMRFQCVSKTWSSIIKSRRDFIDSIMTRSLSQPPRDAHIIFHYGSGKNFLTISSSACPQNTSKELIFVPRAFHHSVRGLICCWSSNCPVAIFNPTTRQCLDLPEFTPCIGGRFLLGYDPLKNQYKVLYLATYTTFESHQVFTIGDPTADQHWRTIQGSAEQPQYPWLSQGVVCINGAIFYLTNTKKRCKLLMSFDVGSEKLSHVDAPKTLTSLHYYYLVNYQGKLGFICLKMGVEIWVMETQGWSKIFSLEMDGFKQLRVMGITRDGEVVFVREGYLFQHKLCIYYYDLKLNSMRYVNLEDYYKEEGSCKSNMSPDYKRILTVTDYVENMICFK